MNFFLNEIVLAAISQAKPSLQKNTPNPGLGWGIVKMYAPALF